LTPSKVLIVLIPYTGQFREATFYPERVVRDRLRARARALGERGYHVHLREWEQPVSTSEEAREIGERHDATLVIWGEFDDISGVRTFIEIIPELPSLDIQQSGGFFTHSPYLLKQVTINGDAILSASKQQACLGEDFPSMADYAVLVSLGIVDISHSYLEPTRPRPTKQYLDIEALFTEAIDVAQEPRTCRWQADKAFYWRGVVRTMQNRYLEARADFEKSVEGNSEFWPALAHLGSVNLALGLPAEAYLQAALDRMPEHDVANRVIVRSNLCLAWVPQGGPEDILSCYRAIEADMEQKSLPPEVQVLYLLHLGNWYYGQRDCGQAEQTYDEALMLLDEGQSPEAVAIFLENKGLAAICSHDYGKAAEQLSRARSICEQHQLTVSKVRVQIRIGMLDYERGEEYAESAFETALVLAQQAPSAYFEAWSHIGLGLTAARNEERSKACGHFREARDLLKDLSPFEADIVENFMRTSGC
jgi:tetratricopeptide (TPR) repeat protein